MYILHTLLNISPHDSMIGFGVVRKSSITEGGYFPFTFVTSTVFLLSNNMVLPISFTAVLYTGSFSVITLMINGNPIVST